MKTGNSLTIAEWLTDKDSISSHIESDRNFFWFTAASNSAVDILKHPTDTDKAQKSFILYQDHVPTSNGTAGYADIRKWWEKHSLYHAPLGTWCHLVIGDQQSFSRMVWLMRKEPQSFSSLVPFPGDFHFAVHMLMAIHVLWWKPLISWLVINSDICAESTTEDWSSVELYNRYRFLYEAIIVGIVAYINEVFPKHLLEQPDLLLQAASERNKGNIPTFQLYEFNN